MSNSSLQNISPLELAHSARPRIFSFDTNRAQQMSSGELIGQRECRICFQADVAGHIDRSDSSNDRLKRHGTLIKPCLCRGTMAYVHETCLLRWLKEKRISHCELCQYPLQLKSQFSQPIFLRIVWGDLKNLGRRQDKLLKLTLQTTCIVIYIKHFLPTVRFLRTKMMRDLCKLWMIFEQEEKLREAQGYSCKMKVRQVISQEIPITIKLMLFMWILRKFVSIGGKYLIKVIFFLYNRWYQGSMQLKLGKDKHLRAIQQASQAAAAARVRANSLDRV